MKKCIILLILLLLLTGCSRSAQPAQIAATTLPVYEFTSRLCEGTPLTITRLVTCQYYTVCRAVIEGKTEFDWNVPFVNVSVLSGEGTLDGQKVTKGDHMLLTANYGHMTVEGNLELMYSHI